MGFDMTITVSESMSNGELTFIPKFSRSFTSEEKGFIPSVNMSRAGSKNYPLDRINEHAGKPNWNDGASIHSVKALSTYKQRVLGDIQSAWSTFKSNVAKAEAARVAAATAAAEAAKKVHPSYAGVTFFSANGS